MLPIYRSSTHVFNYDQIPPGYYFKVMTEGPSAQRFWHQKKFEQVASFVSAYDEVLDFGCGPGSFLHVLQKKGSFIKATGMDLASGQIEFARTHLDSYKEKITLVPVQHGQTTLPFADKQFSVITCIEVIEHIHPYVVAHILNEFKRCLKDDGRIIVTTPNYRSLWPIVEFLLNKISPVQYHEQHINKFTPNSFIKFLETLGLEVRRYDSFFIIAPFLAPISERLASWVLKWEKKLFPLLGSLLIAEVIIDPQFKNSTHE